MNFYFFRKTSVLTHHSYSAKRSLPMMSLLISLVPAPISYSLASLNNLPVGYSLMYPFPPKIWIPSSATWVAFSAASRMQLAASLARNRSILPWSAFLAVAYVRALAYASLVYMSAIFPWMSWNSPMRFPNCFLSCT